MKAKARQWWYLIAGVIAAIIPILVQLNIITTNQSENAATVIEALSSLLGGGAAIMAGTILAKQRRQGLDDLVKQAPIDLVLNNIPVVVQQAQEAEANVARMKSVAADVIGSLTNAATKAIPGQVDDLAVKALNEILR